MNDIVRPPEDSAAGASTISELEAAIANAAEGRTKEAAKAFGAVTLPPAPVSPAAQLSAPAPAAAPGAAVPAAAAPAQAEDPAEVEKRRVQREKRLVAAREHLKSSKTKPLLFVLWTLGAWWTLSVLVDIVITCVPGGATCRAPQLVATGRKILGAMSDGAYQGTSGSVGPTLSHYDWALLLLSLLAALWVAKAKVYPETDDTGEFTEAELNGKE